MDDLHKFKHLLEYFVAHLEYVVNKDTTSPWYVAYIKPLVEKNVFKNHGQGHDGYKIQKQIEKWDSYSNGYNIKINISGASKTPYQNNACYLNWEGTWVNVRPYWDNNHIAKLYLSKEEKSGAKQEDAKSIGELGLFDKNEPNTTLGEFFRKYQKLLEDYNSIQRKLSMNEQTQECINLLRSTHNLILTGAPGTGKTYLAKQIAKAMECTDDEIKFVQFHPSYDYTDFVEGLRPIQDENGNVGFERKDGVFKEFCKKALLSQKVNAVDNFNEAWDKLVEVLNEKQYIEIPFLSDKTKSFRVELNEYGTGLANRTYKDDDFQKGEWIKGQSKFFNKDQLYNIYRGLQGVPSGGHDNYRRAIVEELKTNFDLKPYQEGTTDSNKEKKFVFIIDEINRGEISKIFGELFFSIDLGYRGEEGRVQTQYQNLVEDGDVFKKGFYVPENVYIIGTMNDIDRSVESMDFAFRRRFAFKEVTATDSQKMLDSDDAWDSKKPNDEIITSIKNRMDNLNNKIWHKPTNEEKDEDKSIAGLSSSYHIGASYFLKLNDYNGDFGKLWEYHLEGLLREYLRGMTDVDAKIEALHKAYDNEADSDSGQQQ